jgi:hypothetical protein
LDAAVLAKKLHVDEAVGVGYEADPTAVTSLGDVMRSIESNHPSETCHAK